eukprot:scaffold139_cov325-Pavlova_lutheri.AAC.76
MNKSSDLHFVVQSILSLKAKTSPAHIHDLKHNSLHPEGAQELESSHTIQARTSQGAKRRNFGVQLVICISTTPSLLPLAFLQDFSNTVVLDCILYSSPTHTKQVWPWVQLRSLVKHPWLRAVSCNPTLTSRSFAFNRKPTRA